MSEKWERGLDDFEKQLAADKAERERAEMREQGGEKRKHHHSHRSRHHRSRDEEDHKHKRSRQSRSSDNEGRERQHRSLRHSKTSDPKEDLPAPNDEVPNEDVNSEKSRPSKRDSWMTAPSALDVDYTQKGAKHAGKSATTASSKPDYNLKIHKNELNHRLQDLEDGMTLEESVKLGSEQQSDYAFGDSGLQLRMAKLKAVYAQAKESKKSVNEIAIERFGSLREFENVMEEKIELDCKQLLGGAYIDKGKPSGDLHQERNIEMDMRSNKGKSRSKDDHEVRQGEIVDQPSASENTATPDLNKMKARMMRAKLKGFPDSAKLEKEYNIALAKFSTTNQPDVVVLGKMDNRMLAGTRGEVKAIDSRRGRERGLVEENEDMSIEDMVREERRTKGQAGGESKRYAERIAKDGKFDNDLDYMDDNANKLAKRIQHSEINLKNTAISDFQKMNRILDSCPLCHHEDKNQPPIAPLVSLATRVFLTLPTEPELSEGGACIVPIQHRSNLLECDDDEWDEIRNFMKCLMRMYHDQGRDVMFYENAAAPQRKLHAAMQAVPLPYSLGETAPAFFKEAILSSDEEWTNHIKLIDTLAKAEKGLGKLAFRRSIAKEMPYFHAWFNIDGGLGHIVEDSNRWPKGDLFAREVIGGMLDIEPDVIKRQGKWQRGGDKRLEGFEKRWKKFDWTKVLTDGQQG